MELATIDTDRFGDLKAIADSYVHPMMEVLKAAAEGLQVIDVGETLALAGFKDGLPTLAFSTELECRYTVSEDGKTHLFGTSVYSSISAQHGGLEIPTSVACATRKGIFGPHRTTRRAKSREWITVCPPVPKSVMHGKRRYSDLLCWEVERWEPAPQLQDPVLLRPLYKQFYAVVGQWDLTPLEKELFSLTL